MVDDMVLLKNRIRAILIETPFAVLSTASSDGRPYVRWMTPIFATGDLKTFHTLAAPHSRKIEHIHGNPRVSWVFATADHGEVVTIHGTARIDDDPMLRAHVWESMPQKQRSFILQSDENLSFLIITTQVESLEYLLPRKGQTVPIVVKP
jgi:general stress protein 26